MMKAGDLLNRKKSFVLNRSDSGDVTGDFNEVVGYLSALVYGD
jgi:AmmeMemoRadiSam system protein B